MFTASMPKCVGDDGVADPCDKSGNLVVEHLTMWGGNEALRASKYRACSAGAMDVGALLAVFATAEPVSGVPPQARYPGLDACR